MKNKNKIHKKINELEIEEKSLRLAGDLTTHKRLMFKNWKEALRWEMITIDEFETILKHIQENDEDNRKLTGILVSNACTGFTSFGDKLVYDIVKLLSLIFDDKYEYISWWLWESSNKYVWFEGKKYDLTEVEDLYHWLKGDYCLVKSEKVDE